MLLVLGLRSLPPPWRVVLWANFDQTLTANGGSGTYTFTVTAGSLPPGLNLSSGGVLSGTPSTAGGFNFTVTATDSNSGCTGTRDYGMTVSCPTITLAPGTIPGGQTGVIYSQTVSASAPGLTGAYTFALAVGSNLPPGLSLSPAGQMSSTQSGAFNFTVVATHTASGCTGNGTYNIAIGCPAITLTPTVLPSGTAGTLYNQALSAEPVGSNYAFTLTAGALPTGISLTANGALNGTPTVFGNFSFTVRATDNNSCFRQTGLHLTHLRSYHTLACHLARWHNGYGLYPNAHRQWRQRTLYVRNQWRKSAPGLTWQRLV